MTLDDLADIAQIVVGFGTVVIAGLAIRASRQISAQQQAIALKASRAYVSPEPSHVSLLEAGKPVELTLAAKNWGQTPALRTRVTTRVYLAQSKDNHMRGVPLKIEPEKAEVVLPPLQMLQLGRVGRESEPLTALQLDQIRSGSLILFCDFLCEYYDVSAGKHETSVRYFLDPANLPGKPYAMLSFGKDALAMT